MVTPIYGDGLDLSASVWDDKPYTNSLLANKKSPKHCLRLSFCLAGSCACTPTRVPKCFTQA